MKNKISIVLTPILFAIVLIAGIYLGRLMKIDNPNSHLNTTYPQADKLQTVLNYIELCGD